MTLWLMVAASVCFLLVVLGITARVNLVALGLFCWSLATWIGAIGSVVPGVPPNTLVTVLLVLLIVLVALQIYRTPKDVKPS